MKTSQNTSRLGLYILGIAVVIVFVGAVWAKGNGYTVQTMEGPTMDVMTMMVIADNMPVQNITDAV